MKQRTPRIGIYAGTFDPVHAGHITFALQALEAAKLDRVYFLPERQPRNKSGVEHFGHRVAMLHRALRPHPQFDVLELVDVKFSVLHTLPKLQGQFGQAQLAFLFGSDVISDLPDWPNSEQLLHGSELVIGLRNQDDESALETTIRSWPVSPVAVTSFPSYAPTVSSDQIRAALYQRKPTGGLLSSVKRYSDRHWLYISLAQRVAVTEHP